MVGKGKDDAIHVLPELTIIFNTGFYAKLPTEDFCACYVLVNQSNDLYLWDEPGSGQVTKFSHRPASDYCQMQCRHV
jgi:hypothetical protein